MELETWGFGKLKQSMVRLAMRMDWHKAEAEIQELVREAEEELLEMLREVALTAGECGPIAMRRLKAAAWQQVYGDYFMQKAALDPKEGMVLVGSKLQDAAQVNRAAALELAVRIARGRPKDEPKDALDAYMAPDDPARR